MVSNLLVLAEFSHTAYGLVHLIGFWLVKPAKAKEVLTYWGLSFGNGPLWNSGANCKEALQGDVHREN